MFSGHTDLLSVVRCNRFQTNSSTVTCLNELLAIAMDVNDKYNILTLHMDEVTKASMKAM